MLRSKRFWAALLLLLTATYFIVFDGRIVPSPGSASLVGTEEGPNNNPAAFIDRMTDIRERGKLVAVTGYNPISYFVYRGVPMGYEYELLERLAETLDVELEILVEENVDDMFALLDAGEADLIAYRLIVTGDYAGRAAYTAPIHVTRQVLVQYVDSAGSGPPDDLVEYPFELIGDSVHVPADSEQAERLYALEDEIGGEIDVIEIDDRITSAQLIRRVSRGEYDYSVARESIARLNEAYFPNVVVQPAVSVWQRVAWAVPFGADSLLASINGWLEDEKLQPEFQRLYNKYFEDRIGFRERIADEYLTTETGRLSPYDDLIRTASSASDLGWDWRLLASQMFQESRFKPRARSWAGAQGLMQLMPPTAREFGVSNANDPEQNVAGAIRFLEWLDAYWTDKIDDPDERLKFILASYNTGHGHVEDARRLTEKYGKDPQVWEDVAYYLLRKSRREFYQDPVVRYGYSRGIEPVEYVERILDRFEHYQRFVG
ncbi:MAG: transporter substrate-binding domain-containing protein [Bacteroidota bacterium]